MPQRKIVQLPADDIGPAITEAMPAVLDATGIGLEWARCPAGQEALEAVIERL